MLNSDYQRFVISLPIISSSPGAFRNAPSITKPSIRVLISHSPEMAPKYLLWPREQIAGDAAIITALRPGLSAGSKFSYRRPIFSNGSSEPSPPRHQFFFLGALLPKTRKHLCFPKTAMIGCTMCEDFSEEILKGASCNRCLRDAFHSFFRYGSWTELSNATPQNCL